MNVLTLWIFRWKSALHLEYWWVFIQNGTKLCWINNELLSYLNYLEWNARISDENWAILTLEKCNPWNKNKFCGFFIHSNIKLAQLARVSPNSELHLNQHEPLHFIHINQRFEFPFSSRLLSRRVCSRWIFLYNPIFIQNKPTLCHSYFCSCIFIVLTIYDCAPPSLPIKTSYNSMEKLVE